jgi:3-oxoadipate enol-lactonase
VNRVAGLAAAPRHWIEGAGPAIMFVHGNASTHAVWAGVIAVLRRDYLCISYDLSGHGSAPSAPAARSAEPLTLIALVEELESLRRELKFERMSLVGHSLGALVTAAYAVSYPEHLTALALLAAPAARTPAEIRAGADLVARVKSQGLPATLPTMASHWYTAEYVRRYPAAIAQRLQQIASIDAQSFVRGYELYNATEIAPWLKQIETPTLVMTGEHARGCGAEVAQRLAGRLPCAQTVIFDGFKNGILTEIPERVAAGLSRFLSSLH